MSKLNKQYYESPISSPTTNAAYLDNNGLARKYCPLLVLFPEIEDGSERKYHHHSGHALGSVPPLDQDYHPRDIRFILDNAHLPITGICKFVRHLGFRPRKPSREELLKAMGENRVKYIDLVDERGPKHVDRFWSVYSGTRNKDDNPEYRRKAYVRVVRGSGRFSSFISIQYWLAYFFDDWANVHEMDWEMVSVILKIVGATETPVACVYNAHIGSFRKPWGNVDRVDDQGNKNPQGLHPVAYIANGSHASYFSDYPPSFNVAERYVNPMLKAVIRMANIGTDFTDYVPAFDDERTIKCFPNIETVPEPDEDGSWSGGWRWLNFMGKWGSPAELSLKERLIPDIPMLRTIMHVFERPIREAGPTGPNAKLGSCWNRPFDWANTECLDVEQSRDWLEEISGTSTSNT